MSESDFEIIDTQEMREDVLLQLLAVFVNRFGGEVMISAREFGAVEGCLLLAKHVTPEHLRLRLGEEVYPESDEAEPFKDPG